MGLLETITARKRVEVEQRKKNPLAGPDIHYQPRGDRFFQALKKPGLSVIAEVKRRSPSAGSLNDEVDPAAHAARYAAGGADAVSGLPDGPLFGGSPADLPSVREAVSIPLIRKDFIIDPFQLKEAVRFGADAVLLIVRILTDEVLTEMQRQASDLGLAVLVEAHSQQEAERAVQSGASIIGINNRNLDTLSIDLNTSVSLRSCIPEGIIAISESGIRTPEDTTMLRAADFDGVLVGETLMKSTDPRREVETLKGNDE